MPAHEHDLRACCDELRLLAEAGFWEEARAEGRRLLERWPREPEVLGLLGALAHRTGAISDALAHWNALYEAVGAAGSSPAGLDTLGLLAASGDFATTAADWASAAHAWDLLTRSGRLSAYERLATSRRRLGNEAGARRAELLYEDAFRRRMHWLSPGERMQALLGRPIPLSRLRGLELPPVQDLVEPGARGIALLSRGHFSAARRALSGADDAWLALAQLGCGEAEEAVRLAVDHLLREGPRAPTALILASAAASAPRAPIPTDAFELACAAIRPMVERAHPDEEALHLLALLSARMGWHEEAAQAFARLRALRQQPWPPAGIARAVAICAVRGRQRGLVHDVIARRHVAAPADRGRLLEAEVHGEFASGVRGQLRRTFAAVREWLTTRFPDRRESIDAWAYGIHVTKEDQPSGGPSIGLPAAMAFVSAMLDLPIPRHVAFTGALSYDAFGRIAVLPVGDVTLKLKGALHAGARLLVLPESQRREALSGEQVPRRIAERSTAFVSTLDDALDLLLSIAVRPPAPPLALASGGEKRGGDPSASPPSSIAQTLVPMFGDHAG